MKIFDKKDIVKIAEDDLKDAKLSSIDFSGDNTKKRAFIDVLAARLAMKLLFSKKIEANNLYSLYTIHNILEEIDIADIYFQGIKIDVRLVFNKEEIFIPKSHFQYDLLPDLYVVLGLEDGLSSAELLGFFEPKELDKNNANKDFYFFEYEKLSKPDKIKNFLDSFVSEENFTISEDDFSAAAELFLPLVDKEISKKDKLFLFNKLAKNLTLREQMVEFENFELLSNATAKSEILGDGLLDIVGAQTLFDEEGNEKENLPFVEIETGDDSDFEIIEDDINEILPEKEEIEDEINETLPEKEEIEDAKKSDSKVLESGLNVVAAGLGLGGAIVAGAAGMAMAENGLAKGSAEIAAAGVGLGSEIVSNAVENLSNRMTETGKAAESNGIEILDNDDELELPEFNDDNSLETPGFGDNTEEVADIDFETLKEDDLSELNFAGENDANVTIDNEISNIEQLLAQEGTLPESVPDEYFNNEDDVPEFKPAGDFLMENQDALADLKNPDEDTDEEEESDFDIEDEKDEEKNASEETLPDSNAEEAEAEAEESTIEELEETAPIDMEELAPIEKIEDIEPEKFEEPETLEIEELPTIDETFEQPLDDLPEIKDFEEIEPVEPTIPKETEEEKVFSLDDFDFEMVDENSEKSEEGITEPNSDSNLVSFDSIKAESNPNYDSDEETFARIREIEDNEDEDENEEEPQTYKNENETNGSDDLVSQVDEFLKDIELSDEQRNLLEDALADDKQEIPSESPAVSEDEPVFGESTDTEENDMLKVLFKDEKIEEIPEIDFEEKKAPSTLTKKKKMIVAASAAGIVLVSLIVGGTAIHHNNMKNSNNLNAPISADANTNSEYPQDSNMNADTTMPSDSTAQQPVQNIPGENQQADANRDMGKAVSDAFMSEPVNATISKIAWEVPEDLAYNDNFRKYLQTAGKNMKLNLQNDLLLATEMAYSNKVVIDLDISKDGSLASENIVTSSGSKQIDKIVLQSVKETLKYLKMPSSELSGGSAPATLIINF